MHVDYAGPFLGKMFLRIVDAYSKWIDVRPTNVATSEATIEKLRVTFANQGVPEVLSRIRFESQRTKGLLYIIFSSQA